MICPKCGGKIQVRKSKKKRKFYICENNPDKCDYISWNKPGVEPKKTTDSKADDEMVEFETWSDKQEKFIKVKMSKARKAEMDRRYEEIQLKRKELEQKRNNVQKEADEYIARTVEQNKGKE